MYLNYLVHVPQPRTGISIKTIKGTKYVYYNYGYRYNKEKKRTEPQSTSIGKCDADNPDMMYPNQNYLKYFPNEERQDEPRSSCLRIGAFLVIRKIIRDYHLDKMAESIVGKQAGLFLDLAAYSIVMENNAGQYYPDYAYNHPLFTENMKVYSDSTVSRFINGLTGEQSAQFLNEWNACRDHRERIYISYDSTNKSSQAGDIDIVEYGHPKVDEGAPIFNYAVAYDRTNSVPLFYESYPGSISDVSQFKFMIDKAIGYGYRRVAFILDRGYFSKTNIQYMMAKGFGFIIMVKGMKALVSKLVLECKGKFEEKREYSIREFNVSGMTVKRRMYPEDNQDSYFHIYYSTGKCAGERERLESRFDQMAKAIKMQEGKPVVFGKPYTDYFNFIYDDSFGDGKPQLMFATEKKDSMNYAISLCGYFVIITSERMTAKEALITYKSRDVSEKLFRGDKSYLNEKSMRSQSRENLESKLFIEFNGLIIRNKIYINLTEEMARIDKKREYMTVPAALKELEKIELIKLGDGSYRLDHAITATQKAILKAFGMSEKDVADQAMELAEQLAPLPETRKDSSRQDNCSCPVQMDSNELLVIDS